MVPKMAWITETGTERFKPLNTLNWLRRPRSVGLSASAQANPSRASLALESRKGTGRF
jgi:hypothetical protein